MNGRRNWGAAAAAVTIMLVAAEARAIVTQIDGQVLPQLNALQTGLDRSVANGGEGQAGALDAIDAAAVYPEVFLIPRDGYDSFRVVEFFDVMEGAGYENTFGWYNVEDPTTLYGALTCVGDDASVNHEPGAQVFVDFQEEYDAGRYLGGFVGFFLVSSNENNACGEPSDLGVGRDFVVYTEAQLNGDGNYVHYLIYESVTLEDTYYFGFEDLWRGGDNDFEDMLIRVTGLIQPCVPSTEICNGLDDNCDGLVDNDPLDVGTECVEIPENNPGTGICEAGKLVCVPTGEGSAELECQGEVGPEPEICNELDDDCDGALDAADPSMNDDRIGVACGEDPVGDCTQGTTTCLLGIVTCIGGTGPAMDFCDGSDNDCDGVVDGSIPDGTEAIPCDDSADCPTEAPFCLPSTVTGGDVCARDAVDAIGNCPLEGSTCPGVRRCVDASIHCAETEAGTEEICDGADNDCDGLVDEGDPGGGAECAPLGEDGEPISMDMAHTGQCRPGVLRCRGGRLQCLGGRAPTPEICDGLDNDCDGVSDQAAECPGENLCVEGRCAEPCGGGEFPCPGSFACIGGYCLPDDQIAAGGAGSGGPTPPGGAEPGASGQGPGPSGEGGNGGSHGSTATGNRAGQGPTDEDDEPRAWGLATGGGGLSCAMGRRPSGLLALGLGLCGLLWSGRRHRRARHEGRAR
ncbi:MAG: DUF4114 domain-containing protein [Polyangiaceae bacterium]|nr:DUF4114 domain-containing protein [Polyangiaceae bacterium]